MSKRAFRRALAAIAILGLLVRVGVSFWYDSHIDVWGDAFWYSNVGRFVANGKGFLEPITALAFQRNRPTAAHPPLYALYLSIISHIDASFLAQRLWSSLVGIGTITVIALLTRDLAGERAGLVAAVLGALMLDLATQDALLMSEGLFAFTIVLAVFLSYRFIRRPNLLGAGLLGGAIAAAALTRAEGALLFLILLVPLALRARELALGRRVACIAVGGAVGLALFAPWLAYNAGRFEHPVYLSTGLGAFVSSSNCDTTYRDGDFLGSWGFVCGRGALLNPNDDETVQDKKLLDAGVSYARDHADRLPVVIPVRLLRSFGFYQPVKSTVGEILPGKYAQVAAWAAALQYWAYLGLGIAGVVLLHRKRVPLLPFIAPVVTVVVITVVGYGTMRFRVALDVILPVMAGIALDAAWVRFRAPRGSRPDVPVPVAVAAHPEGVDVSGSVIGNGYGSVNS